MSGFVRPQDRAIFVIDLIPKKLRAITEIDRLEAKKMSMRAFLLHAGFALNDDILVENSCKR